MPTIIANVMVITCANQLTSFAVIERPRLRRSSSLIAVPECPRPAYTAARRRLPTGLLPLSPMRYAPDCYGGQAPMTMRVLIAGILGGVAMYIWSTIAHVALPLGQTGFSQMPNEAAVLAAAQASNGAKD